MGHNAPVVSVNVSAGRLSVRPFFRHDDYVIQAAPIISQTPITLFELESRVFPIEQYGPDVLSVAKFRYFLHNANAIILVMKNNESVIGYAILLFRKNSNKARIYAMAMDKNMRGKGCGMALMNAIESICHDLKCENIGLETRADNIAMQSLCMRAEYERTAILKQYYFDKTDAYKYRKKIKINSGT